MMVCKRWFLSNMAICGLYIRFLEYKFFITSPLEYQPSPNPNSQKKDTAESLVDVTYRSKNSRGEGWSLKIMGSPSKCKRHAVEDFNMRSFYSVSLPVKLARNRKHEFWAPKVGSFFLVSENGTPASSGKSRLVKYYSIWLDHCNLTVPL